MTFALFIPLKPCFSLVFEKTRGQQSFMGRSNFAMDSAQKADARAALALLEGTGLTLEEAAKRAIEKMRAVERVTISECAELFVRSRLKEKCRQLTIDWYENKLGRLTAEFGDREMDSLSRADLRNWLDDQAVSESTRASYARATRAMWRWAIAQEPPLAGHDVTTGMKVSPPAGGAVAFLPVEECRLILDGAGKYTAAFALMLFAGVRPYEVAGAGLKRLRWEHVNVSERIIRVPADVAKTGSARVVEGLPDVIWFWLAPLIGRPETLITTVNAPALIEKAALLAGYGDRDARVREWPHDAMRHTFASYAVALTSDPGKVSLWLGHEGAPTLLYRHYRGLTTKAEAEKFWSLARPLFPGHP
jgi:integrase